LNGNPPEKRPQPPPDPEPPDELQVELQAEPGAARADREPDDALQAFRFLTDHNVPDSVGNTLRRLGHDVVRLREVMAVNTTDPVVAQAAIRDRRILVTWDRDFNQQRFMSPRFAELSRLSMSGPEMEGAARLEQVFDVVAFAICRAADAPITIRVGVGKVQLHI
jgi:Domain of unknown function (DUF5615)